MASTVIPLVRPGTPVEAADAVYLLCTLDSDYVNGQCLVVAVPGSEGLRHGTRP